MESILTSIKKLIGISAEDTNFDLDVIIHINTAFTRLRQLGVGPKRGFRIEDDSLTWNDYIPEDDMRFESVKTYIYLKVKLVFDAQTLSSAMIDTIKETIKELEWELNVDAETPIEEEEELYE